MGNCLVTKLKGTVDNNSLLKIGEFKFDAKPTSTNNIVVGIQAAGDVTVRTNSPVLTLINPKSETVLSGSTSVVIPQSAAVTNVYVIDSALEDTITLYVDNKYKIQQLHFQEVVNSVIDLTYMEMLSSIRCWKNCKTSTIIGEIPDTITSMLYSFYDKTTITRAKNGLEVFNNNGGNDMVENKQLSTFVSYTPNLTDLRISGNKIVLGDNYSVLANISTLNTIVGCNAPGTLENFVRTRRALPTPQATGSVNIQWAPLGVTFNGEQVPRQEAALTLSWTATTMTFNGVTIDA